MQISKDTFTAIGLRLNLTKEQIEAFWSGLEQHDRGKEVPSFSKYLFYFGALIVISAMGWLMSLGVDAFGGGGLFLIAIAYSFIFTVAGSLLWNRDGLRVPAGLLITLAVCMVPIGIYGLETYFNLWPEDGSRHYDLFLFPEARGIFMEIGTIVAGAVALYFFRFPFLTVPIFIALYVLSLDTIPYFFGKATLIQKYWCSLFIGLLLIAAGFILDSRKKGDFAFWSYLFGTLTFWVGLNGVTWDGGEWVQFIFLMINLMMMCLSILLRRKVLMVFGALGVFGYLSHLTYSVFKDSTLFPFVLTAIGLAIIYLGYLYQKNAHRIEAFLFDMLPKNLRHFFNKVS